MEQINIFFFVIGTFFGMDDSKIAASFTTVTINPQHKEIIIVQEDLITAIKAEEEKAIVLKEWDKLYNWKDKNLDWAKELDSYTFKDLTFKTVDDSIQVVFKLKYTTKNDLRAFGVWYNNEKKQFSINNQPQQNLSTENGILEGNYWTFKEDESFSFTIQPFTEIPVQYQKLIKKIDALLKENKD